MSLFHRPYSWRNLEVTALLFSAPRNKFSAPSRAAVALVLLTLVAACGRSAPEGSAAAATEDGSEPVVAGVQIVSETPVVAPGTTLQTVPTTAATTPPAAAGAYVVESGDTLSVIAEQFGVSVAALSQANGITDVDTIRPGQELIIPAG